MNDVTLLRADTVADRLAVSRSQLYLDVRRGVMPPPIRKGKCISWPDHEVNEIAQAVIGGASDAELRALTRALIERRTAGKPQVGAELPGARQ